MHVDDPSTSECLRILLEEQSRKLRLAALRVETLCDSGAQAMQAGRWSGLARMAHDGLAQNMLANLASARHAMKIAAEESARAVATLADRVG